MMLKLKYFLCLSLMMITLSFESAHSTNLQDMSSSLEDPLTLSDFENEDPLNINIPDPFAGTEMTVMRAGTSSDEGSTPKGQYTPPL